MFQNLEKGTKQLINKVQISINPTRFIEDSAKIDFQNVFQLKAIMIKIISKILPLEAVFEETERIIKVQFEGKATQTQPDGKEIPLTGKMVLYRLVGQIYGTNDKAWAEKRNQFYFHTRKFNIIDLDEGVITKHITIQDNIETKVEEKIAAEDIVQQSSKIQETQQTPKFLASNRQEDLEECNQNQHDYVQSKEIQPCKQTNIQQPQQPQQQKGIFQKIASFFSSSSSQPPQSQVPQSQPQSYSTNMPLFKAPQVKLESKEVPSKAYFKPENQRAMKKQYIQERLHHEQQEKYYGYNQLSFQTKMNTNINLQQNDGLLQQINHTLSKIGIIVELKADTLERKFVLSGPVEIINPNRTINYAEYKNEEVIKIMDLDYQVFYFTNPELLPVFMFGSVPNQILEYNKMINKEMEQKRKNQKQNKYQQTYNVLSKDQIEGSRIYIYEGETFYCGVKEAIKWLNKAGFKTTYDYSCTKQLREFDYDIIWISSSASPKLSEIDIQYIIKKFNSGVGLFLWADNQPYYGEANQILAKLINPKYQLIGDYLGQKLLKASVELKHGTFDLNHPVSSGFATLHEGVTICHPVISHPDIDVFAYNTNPNLEQSLVYRKPKQKQGYLWIDNGFTKYMDYDKRLFQEVKKQVEQYIVNVCCTIMRKKKL